MRDGLLLIDKGEGPTSHDVVAAARRILRLKKIGHCGTLDPSATGLLPLTVGRATRLTRFLIRAPKVYEGSARFGMTTDTYDLAGEVTSRHPVDGLEDDAIRTAMESFHGQYLQTPPAYCAKKIGGVKYYELARRGEAVPDQKKEVTVFDFRALGPWRAGEEECADLPFVLSCSSGTYARSMVHELGQILGCGAVLSGLRRTRVGPFAVDDAITIDLLRQRTEAGEDLGRAWLPFDEIPLPFGEIVADSRQEQRLKNGQTFLVREKLEGREGDWIKVVDQRRKFIAVGSVIERIGASGAGVVQPKVVFQ